MPRRTTRASTLAAREGKPAVEADNSLLSELQPYIIGMLKTLGIAGSASEDGKPGDVKAAALGIEVYLKLSQGTAAERGKRLLEAIGKLRAGPTGDGSA